jgi:hypothetical protein
MAEFNTTNVARIRTKYTNEIISEDRKRAPGRRAGATFK